MSSLPYRIYLRGQDGTRVGEVALYTEFRAVRRHNAGGTWRLELPAEVAPASLIKFTTGDRGLPGIIVVDAQERTWLSGPWTRIVRESTPQGDALVVEGVDDTATLGDRWAEPSPYPYTSAAYDVQTGPAERLLHTYVARNAIAGACTAGRELPGLVPGVDQGRGSTFTVRARFDNLLDLCQRIAATDGLGFRVAQQAGSTRALEVTVPRDLRNAVVFSVGLGNVVEWTREERAANATVVVAAGQGEGEQRLFVQREDSAAVARYGRREVFVDRRDTQSTTELDNAAATALAQGAGGVVLDLTPRDTAAVAYGRDYEVGDLVSVDLDGERLDAVVTEVTLVQDASGWRITPTLSTTPTSVAPQGGPRSLSTRVSALERTVETFTRGMIVAWRRPVTEIPNGWQLADGTLGTLDLRGRFLVGVLTGDPRWGILGATGGSATVNLAHSHGMAHSHAHSHTLASHSHAHSHGMTHTHGHSHTVASHTHAHAHSVALDHSHTITTSTDLAHTHAHTHDMSHGHGNTGSASLTFAQDVITGSTVTAGQHTHSTNPISATTGSNAVGASWTNAQVVLGITGSTSTSSDSTGSGVLTTSSDSTGSSASATASDSTGSGVLTTASDSTGASTTTTDPALTTVETAPPFTAVYWIERII